MHRQPDIFQIENRASEIVPFYNSMKGGVDMVDQMMDVYRSNVGTNRWTMVVFFTILGVTALNALFGVTANLTGNRVWERDVDVSS